MQKPSKWTDWNRWVAIGLMGLEESVLDGHITYSSDDKLHICLRDQFDPYYSEEHWKMVLDHLEETGRNLDFIRELRKVISKSSSEVEELEKITTRKTAKKFEPQTTMLQWLLMNAEPDQRMEALWNLMQKKSSNNNLSKDRTENLEMVKRDKCFI